MNWYLEVLKKYAVFDGRARRTEYWMFTLINIIITFVISLAEGMVGSPGIVYVIYCLAVFIPSIAVMVRRLHDIGKTGWWVLIGLVPLVGAIVLIIFAVMDSQPGDNEYGPNPKESVI